MKDPYSRYALLMISVLTVVKLYAAGAVELGNDEVYYWTYALFPDWSHFDHPPMVGWMLQVFTGNLLFNSELFLRLGSICLSGLSAWIIFRMINERVGGKAAFITSLMFMASVYTTIISGWMIMPDAPQIFFWVISLNYLLLIAENTPEEVSVAKVLLAGIFIGFALLSKYHSIMLWAGTGLFILAFNRVWLTSYKLYLSIFISILIFSPVIFWNLNNDLASVNFHSDRIGFFDGGLRLDYFGIEIAGEILYQNPFIIYVIIVVIGKFLMEKSAIRDKKLLLLLCIALPHIFIFWFVSLFHRTLPHWSGPAFVNLIIFTGLYLGEKFRPTLEKSIKSGMALIFLILIIGPTVINSYPGSFSPFNEEKKLGKGDVTLDMYGWRQLNNKISSRFSEQKLPLVSSKWYPAAHVDYYIAQNNDIKLVTLGKLKDTHKYEEISRERGQLTEGTDAYFLSFSTYWRDPNTMYNDQFEKITLLNKYEIKRGDRTVKNVFLYLMENYRDNSNQ